MSASTAARDQGLLPKPPNIELGHGGLTEATASRANPAAVRPAAVRPASARSEAAWSEAARPGPARPAVADVAPAEHHGLGLALILLAAFMVVLDFSIVNVALPSIEREFGFSAAAVQWVVTGYAITFGGLLILGGRAADMFGRRRMFIAGLLLFTAASLAGGLAHDPVLLVMSRVVQGAGAAIVAPAAFSLITTGFAEGPRRNRALGWYGATASVGFVAGQVLGGVLVEFLSWRAVFLVNVPVGVVAALLAPKLLGESRQRGHGRRMDVGGAVLITIAVAAIVFAVSQSAAVGWASPLVAAALGTAVAAAAAFWLVERRHLDPLVRADLLRLPGLRKAGMVNVLLGLWNAGEMIVLSIYFQQVLHDSPLVTGLAVAPQGVVGFSAGLLGARLTGRVGIRRVLILTSGLAMAGFLVLTHLPATGSYSLLLLAVMPVGFGTAGTAFGTMVIASGGVADSDQGLVGGVVNTSRQMGAAIGAALLPAVAVAANHRGAIAGVAGDRAAMLAAAAAAALAMLIAIGGTAWRKQRPSSQPRTGIKELRATGTEARAIGTKARASTAELRAASTEPRTFTAERLNKEEPHAGSHARQDRPTRVEDRVRHLAAWRRLGRDRRVRRDRCDQAGRRPGRHDFRHRAGLRVRRIGTAAGQGAEWPEQG
jgi:EmrB/QacA subfamily drug resistance transporter